MSLQSRLDKLDAVSRKAPLFVWVNPGESSEQALARWCAEPPRRRTGTARNYVHWLARTRVGATSMADTDLLKMSSCASATPAAAVGINARAVFLPVESI
jgi:hypothetical protein